MRLYRLIRGLVPTRQRTYSWHYEHVLGTSLELHVTADSARAAEAAERAALATIDRLNAVLSSYSRTSELTRWSARHDVWTPVSAPLAEVLQLAEAWRVRTGGAFHPGAQAIIDALRDAGDTGHSTTPRVEADTDADGYADAKPVQALSDGALAEALAEPLWEVTRTDDDAEAGTPWRARRHTRLSCSLDAIAKGYIVDEAALAAHAVAGVSNVLLNIGGDLRHLGATPVAVQIMDPFAPEDNAPPVARITLCHQTLATSGGYFRTYHSNGQRVSHLVDPRTQQPVEQVVSASVIAPDCATADVLSTTFSVLTPAESVAMADATPHVACLVIEADGRHTASARWAAHLVPHTST